MKMYKILALLCISTFSFGQFGGGGYGAGGGGMRRNGMGNSGGSNNMQTNTTREKLSPEERSLKLTDALQKKLDLNTEQYGKVSEINLRYAKQTEGFISKLKTQNDQPEIMMKQMKDFRIKNEYDRDNEMKTVLDEEQFKKYQKYKSRMEEQQSGFQGGGNYGGGNYGGGRGGRGY